MSDPLRATCPLPEGVELLLFVDYDGVVQRPAIGEFSDFEFLPQLEQVLRDYPNIGMVPSTTHREDASLAQMRMLYSPDVQHRIVGTTPVLVEGRADGGRHAEICAFLDSVDWRTRPWLALDDDARLYPKGCPQLIQTWKYGGFDEIIEEMLRSRLDTIFAAARERPVRLAIGAAEPLEPERLGIWAQVKRVLRGTPR